MKILWLLLLPMVAGCLTGPSADNTAVNGLTAEAYHPSDSFNDYWYRGEAELTSFDLKQARYGQIRNGIATLIFVTEHLDSQTLVKTDEGTDSAVPVIKLNATRKFHTGIYPYSLMTSVFTPVNRAINSQTLKETFTAQEWCGHQFQMVKWNGQSYQGRLNSYFEGEADQQFELNPVMLEDEIWNLIRMGPDHLPSDTFQIIPSFTHTRLAHKPIKPYQATARLTNAQPAKNIDTEWQKYTLTYTSLDRTLTIFFEMKFPHRIMRWEETVVSGFGNRATTLTTTATRKKSIMLDYWNKNSIADSTYRQQMGY